MKADRSTVQERVVKGHVLAPLFDCQVHRLTDDGEREVAVNAVV